MDNSDQSDWQLESLEGIGRSLICGYGLWWTLKNPDSCCYQSAFQSRLFQKAECFSKIFQTGGVYVQRRWVRSWVVACCNSKKKSQIVQKQPKLGKVATSFQVTMGFIAPRGMMALEEEMVARSIRWADTCNGGLCLTKLLAAGHQESSTAIDWFNDMILIIYYIILYVCFLKKVQTLKREQC